MPARRSLSLLLAMLATCLLLAWIAFHEQFLNSALATLICFALAGGLAVQAVRLAWLAPVRETVATRL